jgi:tetrahydromethanopterin S-methyltransferase subunit G
MQVETMKTPTEDTAKSKEIEKVHDKLEEIDAKVKALKEAMQNKDVVIKTWYESE